MEKVFALIKNNLVVNTIVIEDESFLSTLQAEGACDYVVRIDELEIKPGIGFTCEQVDGEYIFSNEPIEE